MPLLQQTRYAASVPEDLAAQQNADVDILIHPFAHNDRAARFAR